MNIRWTNTALVALAGLTDSEREEIFERLELVLEFPAMYPVRERGAHGRFRYFVIRRRWIVYYRVLPEEVRVVNIHPARARPS